MNGRIKMKIVDSSYKGEPVDACELCSDFELGYGVIHVGTVCPIEEARTIARKLYAEVKRLKAYIEFDRRQRITDGRSR